MSIRRELVNDLESLSLFQNRYENIKCINFNPTTGTFKGQFSIIFKAIDKIEKEPVAIKFFAPDAAFTHDVYRIQAFEREPEILKCALGKKRCLQLLQGLSDYILNIPTTTPGGSIPLQLKYFIIQWLDKEIDEYFEKQELYEPIDKLLLFNDIISAVEAIHSCNIYHRDLKPDNFRECNDAINRVICAIDYGTAARYDTPNLVTPTYTNQVGHRWYSAPEALCGLAGNRDIAKYTDYYSLGCMLFELFNSEYLGLYLLNNPQFLTACAYMTHKIYRITNDDDKLIIWNKEISRVKKSVIVPKISHFTSSAPNSIDDILDIIVQKLVSFDYKDRAKNLEIIRKYIFSCIKILENNKYARHRIELKKKYRENHQRKILGRQNKLMLNSQSASRVVLI